MNISIFELVNLMMGEAEERLGEGYVRSEERVSDLKACCSDIANSVIIKCVFNCFKVPYILR